MPGIFDTTYGAALDPSTAGLLSAAFGALQNSGPSLMPRNIGQTIGAAGQAGLGTYQQVRQSNAVIGLEQQKQQLLNAQVTAAIRQNAMQESMLGQLGMLPPGFQSQGAGTPSPAAQQASPSVAPQQAAPAPIPVSAPASGAPNASSAPIGAINQLPPYARTAMGLDVALNQGKGMGPILTKAMGPHEIQGVGSVQYNPKTGQYEGLPGLDTAMASWKRATQGVENENTITDVPLADGQHQRMTKAQELSLVNGTAHIKNVMPWATPELVTNIQRQMLADPEKPVAINIEVAGRDSVKMDLPSLKSVQAPTNGMPGMTIGQSTAAKAAQEASGKEAGGVQGEINKEADNALASRRILGEMRVLAQDFTPGKIAPFKRTLGEWAQALNLPGDWSKEIDGASSQQALQKLTAQMATAAMKQFTNRGTQMEFKTFLQNNPNAELTPQGFQKVLEFMDQTANLALQKQQAYQDWRKTNPVEKSQDFLAEWNKKMNTEPVPSGPKGPPAKGAVVDGWEFLGGDPGQRINWKKK